MHAQPSYTYDIMRSSDGEVDQEEQPPLVQVSMAQSPPPRNPPPCPPHNTHGLAVELKNIPNI